MTIFVKDYGIVEMIGIRTNASLNSAKNIEPAIKASSGRRREETDSDRIITVINARADSLLPIDLNFLRDGEIVRTDRTIRGVIRFIAQKLICDKDIVENIERTAL